MPKPPSLLSAAACLLLVSRIVIMLASDSVTTKIFKRLHEIKGVVIHPQALQENHVQQALLQGILQMTELHIVDVKDIINLPFCAHSLGTERHLIP